MSGTQSTITDRFPIRKPTRHGSILSKDPPPDKKYKSDKTTVVTQEFDPTADSVPRKSKSFSDTSRPESYGLVQRCVIIQRDENGFGLTVSGDNPVFVQSVKEDGAAMRAGVQTGDRIIKVNGTLVTHSNHVEVVKLIKSGSYVALTVLGRPPGLPQIPLSESEGDPGALGHNVTSPHSPGTTASDRMSSTSGTSDLITAPVLVCEEYNIVYNQKVDILQKMLSKEVQDLQAMKEAYSRNPNPKLMKEIQEAKKHIPELQKQLIKVTGIPQDSIQGLRLPSESLQISEVEESTDVDQTLSPHMDNSGLGDVTSYNLYALSENLDQREAPFQSPKAVFKEGVNFFDTTETDDALDLDAHSQSHVSSPSRLASQIIGVEDDDFDAEQEQINGQCSCFQSIELLKTRPAHLAAFLHHVISQFDPAPLLCYLYADLYKQTNSKETRRVFMEFNSIFLGRAANLKVNVPESISADLEKKRPELIPEDVHRQYIQVMQDTLLADVQKNLEDFRQKRNMGLTLAESELTKLDSERIRDRATPDKERSCAEQILAKIEKVLLTSQPAEEEKCTAIHFVIFTYMKHLGVKMKEPRSLEQKRGRIGFPPIKKSIKIEKEGDEKKMKKRFQSILPQPRRSSRHDPNAITRAMETHKQRPVKQVSQQVINISSDHSDTNRIRPSLSSDSSEATLTPSVTTSPTPYTSAGPLDSTSHDGDLAVPPLSAVTKQSDLIFSVDITDSAPRTPNNIFEFPNSPLDNLQEDERDIDRIYDQGTPKAVRRTESQSYSEGQSEDDQYNDFDQEQDPPNWQQLVSRDILAGLTPHEIKRQEVINELFYTERAHIRMLRVLDQVFYQKLSREAILPPAALKHIFSNLDEILQLHASILEQMAAIRKKHETSVIDQIGDDLLSWFSGSEEEKIRTAVSTFCSNQPFALELIKTRQKKDSRFLTFMQEAESNPLCKRLQLKDIIPTEMQRLTKYPLLLENIAKYTEDTEEKEKVKRAGECCRQILNYVNQVVKESENKQRLEDYQRRLDLSSLKQSEYPMISEFRNLDLTKRKMIHEGHLTWKVNRDKTIELYTLLLEDILVLLQKQDDRLIFKCHSKNLAGTAETKHVFSPVIELNSVWVRPVATDNKAFFVISMSDNGAQIYELVAQTVSEQKMWQYLITQRAGSINTKPLNVIALPPQAPPINDSDRGEEEEVSGVHHKLSKDSDGLSAASGQPSEKDSEESSPVSLQVTSPGATTPFGHVKSEEQGEGDEDEDTELDEQLSRQTISIDEEELSCLHSASRAETALKNLAALKLVLLRYMSIMDESGDDEGCKSGLSRSWSSAGSHSTQSHSQRGSMDNSMAPPTPDSQIHDIRLLRGSSASEPCSPRGQGSVAETTQSDRVKSPGREATSGDTVASEETAEQFFDASEGYGNCLILEGFGAVGESSTDDDLLVEVTDQDPEIDLSKLLSTSASRRGLSVAPINPIPPEFSEQVNLYIRQLQADLKHLKVVESRYNLLCQRLAGSASDTEENKDKS
ncbi:rho guanine nucleotide exchange factor 12-like isoform X7 [Erpetoichthys calabaricus]|uniref:Rho guanine nucleotide exchange factor 12 n=1 Tax=Erpetoichthys calabaricus TaxID=27687 RepID=A0A8C4SIL8_ERPCA|nr:rho guanine nucleotide exchange factor 12-like isoform X7 [Erpetoichthys calabaricus]